MIVVDASAMVEALVGADPDPEFLDGLSGQVAAPHLLDIEVLSVLRALTLASKLPEARAVEARARYFGLTLARAEAEPLAERVWSLRHRFTAYDASYVALAEGLRAPLFTCDAKLDAATHRAQVRVFGRSAP